MDISFEMMGGDFSSEGNKKAVCLVLLQNNSTALLYLIGDENRLNKALLEQHTAAPSLQVIHAPQVIGMQEHPTKALKEKPQSSISLGFQLLASGKADAFISAG